MNATRVFVHRRKRLAGSGFPSVGQGENVDEITIFKRHGAVFHSVLKVLGGNGCRDSQIPEQTMIKNGPVEVFHQFSHFRHRAGLDKLMRHDALNLQLILSPCNPQRAGGNHLPQIVKRACRLVRDGVPGQSSMPDLGQGAEG